ERYLSEAFRASCPEAARALRATLLRCDAAGYAACCHAVAGVDWLDRLAQVRCPTLVIAGALDVGAPVAMSRAIVERIEGAELVVLQDAAHLGVLEQPVAFRAALVDLLGRVDAVVEPTPSTPA
ncbi:MAG: hydrolase, partial [Burkholderiaceae bacterium]